MNSHRTTHMPILSRRAASMRHRVVVPRAVDRARHMVGDRRGPEPGRVVIASATCVDRDDAFRMGIRPSSSRQGVAACQASVDDTLNQMLSIRSCKGTSRAIIELLSQDPAFQCGSSAFST
jgi:hypothetical protein